MPRRNGTSATRSRTQLPNAPPARSGSIPRAFEMRQRVFARGSSLCAGSAFKGLLAREDRRTSPEVLRGELSAGGVYVLAPARTERRREATFSGEAQELPRPTLRGRGEALLRLILTNRGSCQ